MYHVNDGVIIADPDGSIVHINRKCEELLGIRGGDRKGKNISDIFPDFSMAYYRKLKEGEQKDTVVILGSRNLAVSSSLFMLDHAAHQLIITVQDVTRIQQMEQNIRYMLTKKGLLADYHFEDILTRNKVMKAVISQAKKISEFDGSVLIYGASGTGKELFAQSIHNQSRRKQGPFVAVNCAAISESLLESELFGYVAGAFTGARKEGKAGMFELAHNGTIFLDEINSMSLNLQSKILRVIEQREVMRVGSDYVIPLNVRVLAASNNNLVEIVRAGDFRYDLYFRLNTFELSIPCLNDRKEDILFLFRHFLAGCQGGDQGAIVIDRVFEEQLLAHNWWGNVRELRSTALRYHAFGGDNSGGEILRPETDLLPALLTDDLRIDLKELNKTIESLVIESLLNQNISKTETARILGISRQALFKKMNK